MQSSQLKRREFITLVGSTTVAWPLAARAQQRSMPVIGFLSPSEQTGAGTTLLDAFRRGLGETGAVEGQNVAIEYRFSGDRYDRLADFSADFVRRKVNVIAAAGSPAAIAAKAATQTIPIAFMAAEDPVKLGLVASLSRPSTNATGFNFFTAELNAKRLGLLHELLPAATRVALLLNPKNTTNAASTIAEVEPAARALGLQLQSFNASTSLEIDASFAALAAAGHHALFVAPDAFFLSRRVQLMALANRHALPTAYSQREYAEAGGLMSYGASLTDAYRQLGVFTGRLLKGAKPADLPVVQSTRFELVINAQIARILGVTVPMTLLTIADEVIE
jgi:putative ABC transport system substrate-binding protein